MYVARFGIMSLLLSEALVSGFTTGAAIGVLTSQVKDLFGIKLTPVDGKFEIPLVRSNLNLIYCSNSTLKLIAVFSLKFVELVRINWQTSANKFNCSGNFSDYNIHFVNERFVVETKTE